MRILSLSGKNGGDAGAPGFLDRGEDSRLVIHQDVVQRGIAGLDIIKREFLVDIDQHVRVDGLRKTGALNLARLENDVAIGEKDGWAPLAQPFEHVQRSRVQTIGERVIDQERRHG
jgi:hypothetical protein